MGDYTSVELGQEQASAGQPQQFVNPGGSATFSFPQFPQSVFVPFQTPDANLIGGERLSSTQNTPVSQLEAQRKFIENQIEVSMQLIFCIHAFSLHMSMNSGSDISTFIIKIMFICAMLYI